MRRIFFFEARKRGAEGCENMFTSWFFCLTLHVPGGRLRYIAYYIYLVYVIVYKYPYEYNIVQSEMRPGEMRGSGILLVYISYMEGGFLGWGRV